MLRGQSEYIVAAWRGSVQPVHANAPALPDEPTWLLRDPDKRLSSSMVANALGHEAHSEFKGCTTTFASTYSRPFLRPAVLY